MKHAIAFIAFSSILIFGCRNSSDPVGYFDPFLTGNGWIYENASYDSLGFAQSSKYDTITIVSSQITTNQKQITLSNGEIATLSFMNSGWNFTEVDPNGAACWRYMLPAKAGDTVYNTGKIAIKVDSSIRFGYYQAFAVVSDTIIHVPAGAFHCALYELDIVFSAAHVFESSLTYISASSGVVLKEFYYINANTGKRVLSGRSTLLRLK